MKYLITGGCGFIGSNAASRYLKAGHKVVVVDHLSRSGKQVGDILFIDDLLDAYDAAFAASGTVAGRAYREMFLS